MPVRAVRQFTEQFRAGAIAMCKRGDRSIMRVARDFGVSHYVPPERGYDRLGVLPVHLHEHRVARSPLDECRDVAVAYARNQIALPVTWDRSIGGLRGSWA